MKKVTRILALALSVVMCLSLVVGCGKKDGGNSGAKDTLVVGYSPFSSKFSPFFSETAYDQDVYTMTALPLLTSDRTGAIVEKGIKGETRSYNGTDYTYYGPADMTVTENPDGTVYYDFTLRDDLKFSDGEPITIDDVIFSMYVLCDPTYDGASTLYAQPIQGMAEYRSGMSTMSKYLGKLGEGSTDFSVVDEATQKAFWDAVNDGGVKFAQEIVDYMVANSGVAEGDVKAAAAGWGFEGLADDATAKDLFLAIAAKYDWNFSAMEAETAGSALSDLLPADVYATSTKAVTFGESAANITGIQKTGDYSMRVVFTEVSATAVYQLGVVIAPMHYYGEKDKYDYANNKFGFDKGDLSHVRSVTTQPMGAGPYKFVKFENGTVNFEANDSYYLGAPKIKYVNFLESQETDKLNGVVTGTIDITDPSFSADTVDAIQQQNSNGELDGDKITVDTVDNLGYGYMGISAVAVNVGGDPGSDASKDLRKGLATVFAAYRELSVESYYGERATVINYPISNTSWAAPQPTDAGYQVAFSVDVDGNPIYTSGMSADGKYAAAKAAALGFFEAAGYTVENGKITAAPEGAKMQYEVQIPADGTGNHPAFMMVTEAKKALAEIGMDIVVTDLSDATALWDGIRARQVDMWCAAWSATPDPDMYQVYYADVADFNGDMGNGFNPQGGPDQGNSSYMYCVADEELDNMIMEARKSLDQSYRKTLYKACLDTIVDWATEVPVYQRQNAIIFSTERVKMETVLPDITTFYGWLNGIQNMELNYAPWLYGHPVGTAD